MGMAASQARLLTLTARLADNELKSQSINNAKMRLAAQSSRASEDYINALNNATLKFANYAEDGSALSQDLTYNALTAFSAYNTQYGIANASGQLLVSESEAALFKAANGDVNKYLKSHGLEYRTSYFEANFPNGLENKDFPDGYKNLKTEELEQWYASYDSYLNSVELEDFVTKYNTFYDNYVDARDLSRQYFAKDVLYGAGGKNLNDKDNSELLGTNSWSSSPIFGTFYNNSVDNVVKKFSDIFTSTSETYVNSNYNLNHLVAQGLLTKEQAENIKTQYIDIISSGRTDFEYADDKGDIQTQPRKMMEYVTDKNFEVTKEELSDTNTVDNISAYGWKTAAFKNNEGTKITFGDFYIVVDEEEKNVLAMDWVNADDATRHIVPNHMTKGSLDNPSSCSVDDFYKYGVKMFSGVGVERYEEIFYYTSPQFGEFDEEGKAEAKVQESQKFDYLYASQAKECLELLLQSVISAIESKANYGLYAIQLAHEFENRPDAFKDEITQDHQKMLRDFKDSMYDLLDEVFKNPEYVRECILKGIIRPDQLQSVEDILKIQQQAVKNGLDPEKLQFKKDFEIPIRVYIMDTILEEHGEPKYAWVDSADKKNSENADAKAQWYTNLFNRLQKGFKELENGLASSKAWIEYALESGIITLEQVDGSNNWNGLDYKACSRITEETDSAAVAKAEAEYNRAMHDIEAKDSIYDMQLKNIDTEHTSLQTEYESISKVISKNIERTFKFNQSA